MPFQEGERAARVDGDAVARSARHSLRAAAQHLGNGAMKSSNRAECHRFYAHTANGASHLQDTPKGCVTRQWSHSSCEDRNVCVNLVS